MHSSYVLSCKDISKNQAMSKANTINYINDSYLVKD